LHGEPSSTILFKLFIRIQDRVSKNEFSNEKFASSMVTACGEDFNSYIKYKLLKRWCPDKA